MKQKIKLRDMTEAQYETWRKLNCLGANCNNCPFLRGVCSIGEFCWVKNKDIYSDKFLNQEVEIEVPDLLTNWEKLYLEVVIRPFKDKVISISKSNSYNSLKQYIAIKLSNGNWFIVQNFDDNKYYKNLEIDKQYTLKDLGLFQSKYKITLSEFWNSKDNLAIHCDAEEKVNKLLEAFDKLGEKWVDNSSYLDKNCYKIYLDKICYTNDNAVGEFFNFLYKNYIIYEFDEVDLEH